MAKRTERKARSAPGRSFAGRKIGTMVSDRADTTS